MKMIKLLSVLFLTSLVAVGCSNNSSDDNADDPFIGNWALRAIYANGSTSDVSSMTCFKDSYTRVTATTATLFLSVPDQNTGSCASETSTYEWINSNGTYYFVGNGQQVEAPIQLNDNNQTLQIAFQDEGFILVFTRQ